VAVFKKNDSRTVYNAIYRDGKAGAYYIKRFNVTSMTRDREYDLTQGKPGSRVVYFTPNPNGEAEVVKVTLKPNPKLKRVFFDKDFSEIAIKGRQSMGNLVTKLDVANIRLSRHGASTLGGRKVWFDPDVKRLNYDGQGTYLGEFNSDEQILVVRKNGEFYVTNFDPNNHYEDDILRIEKYDPNKVWTACLFDADQQGYAYMKRFTMEATARHQSYLGENPESQLILLTDTPYPHLLVTLGGNDDFREPLDLEAEEFIGVKSFKAKGKRITTCNVAKIEELEPTRQPEPVAETPEGTGSDDDPDSESADYAEMEESQEEVADQLNGQLRLFDN
jgi:topoisomerase-4 subunit A